MKYKITILDENEIAIHTVPASNYSDARAKCFDLFYQHMGKPEVAVRTLIVEIVE